MRHVLKASQFDRATLEYIYELTNRIRQFDKNKEGLLYLQGLLNEKRAILYFTQASTRTFLSFQSACQILGIHTLEIRNPSTSSELKGESIDDSLRTFSSYVDLIIMRSPIPGLCLRTANQLDRTPRPVPIINAGSGQDEHPTQAILDIYTLMRSFKGPSQVEGKTICFVGDIKRGRTVRSLAQILCLFKDIKMLFVSPKEFSMNQDLRTKLKENHINFQETDDFENSILQADIIYMTRIQDEHETNASPQESPSPPFSLKKKHLNKIGDRCLIMHPLPRRNELDTSIDSDPRAMYWRQERNGMWIRTALITMIFGVDHKIIPPRL